MSFDVVLKSGHVLDGSGNPWFKADIGIADGKIEEISHVPLGDAERIIDVEGHVICPGFINLHSHSDGTIHYHKNAENCLSMGLVTELVGQCGSSSAPINDSYKEKLQRRFLRRLSPIEEVTWTSLYDWLRKLEDEGIGINIAPLIGHGTIRECVMGEEGEGGEEIHPSKDQMTEMMEMVEKGMEDGAFGLSTGLNYAPGRNAVTSEIIELSKIVSRYGGIYSSHMRDEGDYLLEALKEFIKICDESNVRGTVSHHKASGRGNYGKPCETIRMIDRARRRGVDIIIDQYPWRHGGTIKSVGSRFRTWDVTEDNLYESREKLLEKLKSPDEWEKLKQSYLEQIDKERKLYKQRKEKIEEELGWTPKPYAMQDGGTILYSKSHLELEGKTFKAVGEEFSQEDELEALRSLLIEDEGWTCAGGPPYSEDDVITILTYPWTTVSTDQYAFDNSKVDTRKAANALSMQHPRGWGTYPKILGQYVREEKILPIEEAVRKMTSLPAQFLGLQDRGLVKEGFWADLLVFEPNEISHLSTYGKPQRPPEGLPYVLVNGEIAIEEGKPTGALAGKALRLND